MTSILLTRLSHVCFFIVIIGAVANFLLAHQPHTIGLTHKKVVAGLTWRLGLTLGVVALIGAYLTFPN